MTSGTPSPSILIHAHDVDAGAKRERAAATPRELWDSGSGRLSVQAAAEEVDADELLSEDLNDGQAIAGIRVVNPLKGPHTDSEAHDVR